MNGILKGFKRKDRAVTGPNGLGPGFSQSSSGPAAAAAGNAPVNPVLNFGASGVKALYIRGFAGAVEIEANDTPEVFVEVLGYEPRSTKLTVNLQGESLQIGLKSLFNPVRPWRFILPLRCMLRLTVPRSLSLRCATTSGNIRVQGVRGDLVLETESGKVEVDAPCRSLAIVAEYLNLAPSDDVHRAAFYVLSQNLVHGDALAMRAQGNLPITFAEWGYLGKGRFQRRDFRLDVLTGASAYSQEGDLFANLGKHEIFTPTKTYPPTTVGELAALAPEVIV